MSAAPKATGSRLQVGRTGEELAVAHLQEHGYAIIARNWRTRAGELDIIAQDGEYLVFVEVRTRLVAAAPGAMPRFGPPEESVTPRKQMQLASMASEYLFQAPWQGPWRIDVLALELARDGTVSRLAHYRDAVGG